MKITLGAIAPGEVVELDVQAPAGVDLTAVTRAISVTLERTGQASTVLTPWTTVSTTATVWRVRYSPAGPEFSALGAFKLIPDVTLNGVLYRYATVRGDITPR